MEQLKEIFCEWFEGSFDNRKQTHASPRACRFVTAHHHRTSENSFYCEYLYHRVRYPYRELDFDINYKNGEIHLNDKISGSNLVFVHKGSTFRCSTETFYEGKRYVYKGVLGEGFYHINDQCYDAAGQLLRGLPDGTSFEFKKL